ncbi:DNA repair protein [Salmonella enterica subsp. enterica serovar Daytona]|uniref:DNA repair protein n=1 Tax=Salmonella enterica subsp. enterica serovar Daytona TaxID=1962639 RepID=A0A447JNX9_SALET|nr:DNA repair protein [Salmonella enterica subsp. enterica serovar Daytona]
MAKAPKRAFVCNECGADYPRWQGQCSACHAWNTITEVRLAASPTVARNERLSGYAGSAGVSKVQKLSDISLEELPRFSTGFKEFDRVLGGGVVPGSAILIGGNPRRGQINVAAANAVQARRADENAVRHRRRIATAGGDARAPSRPADR